MSDAIAVVAAAYGGPEVLELRPVDVPDPGPGEVLLDVRAAGVNPIDWKVFSGRMGDDPAALPLRPGVEAAGVVAAVGPGGAEGPRGPLAVGDEVFAFRAAGAWASRIVVPAASCVPKAPAVPWPVAGATMAAGATAVHLLEATRVGPGDVVLVHGASGGVGRLAVQLARRRGAARVIGTARPANHDAVRALGAEPVAYGDGLLERLRGLAPDGVDVALDCVGTDEALETSLALARDRDRLATIVAGPPAAAKGFTRLGGAPGADRGDEIRARARLELADRLAAGELTVAVASYPLAEAAAAVADHQAGRVSGKIALVP